MKNVLIVKTHKTGGRAWAAWKITEDKAKDLEYVVSVNGKRVTVYFVHDYTMGTFWGQDYQRVVFDLEEMDESFDGDETNGVLGSLIKQGVDLFAAGWVVKLAEVPTI